MAIPFESLPLYENAIYFPILLTVFERDCAAIERGSFKFTSPYIKMIEQAIKRVQDDLKRNNAYFYQHKMKLNKLGNDGTFTEYEFIYAGYSDIRRYMNFRLRNRTEELLEDYLMKEAGINARGYSR